MLRFRRIRPTSASSVHRMSRSGTPLAILGACWVFARMVRRFDEVAADVSMRRSPLVWSLFVSSGPRRSLAGPHPDGYCDDLDCEYCEDMMDAHLEAVWDEDDEEDDMGAHRCSQCGESWPPTSEYATCPACGTRTWYATTTDQMDPDEARTRRLELEFERYLEQREAKRTREFVEHMNRVCGPLELPS